MKTVKLSDEEIEIIYQSLKLSESSFYKDCTRTQQALIKSGFQKLLVKFSKANQIDEVQLIDENKLDENKSKDSITKRGRPRKPRSVEPLAMNVMLDPSEPLFAFFDNLKSKNFPPHKIFNPCAGTEKGILAHFLKKRSQIYPYPFVLILNEKEKRISLPLDSEFSPTVGSEWERWDDKEYLSDWVMFQLSDDEADNYHRDFDPAYRWIDITTLALNYSKNVAILFPTLYANGKHHSDLTKFIQEKPPNHTILTQSGEDVWLVWNK